MLGLNKPPVYAPGASTPSQKRTPPALATTLALVTAFLLTAPLQHASVGWATTYAVDQYGYWIEGLMGPLTWLGCACGTYFGSRATFVRLPAIFEFVVGVMASR